MQFRAYLIKDTYVRTQANIMERVWKLVGLRPGSYDSIENPIEAISEKQVLLLSAIQTTGASLERLAKSLGQFHPKNLKIAVAF